MSIGENSGWQLLDQVVGRGALFLFYAAVPLVLGPEDYGTFVFLQALMLMIGEPLMGFGLDAIVVGAVARGDRSVVRSALAIRTVLVASTGLLAVVGGMVAHFHAGVLFCLWLQLGILSVQRLVFSYYRGVESMKMEGAVGAMQKATALPALGLLSLLGVGGAMLPAATLALMACLGAMLMIVLFRGRVVEFIEMIRRSKRRPALGELLRQGSVLGLAASVSIVYFRIDSVMLAWLADASAVAVYNAAYRFMEATFVVPAVAAAVLFPRLARPADARRVLVVGALGLAVAGIVVTAVAVACASPLLDTLYGPAYARAGKTLTLLAFAITPVYVGFLLTQTMIAWQRQHAYLRISLFGLALNVGMNLLLIPTYRESGAAFATVATEVAVTVAAALALRRS